ncbi:MAG: SMC-Scp complex subunit ScpB [Bacilli bacterium]|nr:SMC-Scp complex subunit ScpB [Bacilli bacterium]
MNIEAVLEGLLFVVGDDGLTMNQIKDILSLSDDEAKELIISLREKYEQEDRGIRINFLGNTFKLTTKKEHKEYYQKLIENPETNVLSQSALETLAIIAYNEPLTRMMVDEIRGVSSREMIKKLVAKGLVKEVGRSELPGRPILYKTTSEFLDYFGLASRDELPKFETIVEEITDSVDLYDSKYKEDFVE